MGLEPIISAVKGQRVNQLLYSSKTIRASDRIRTYDLLITSELHYRCAIEAVCSRYEIRTRVGRMKICNPNHLDEPTILGRLMGLEPMTTSATNWRSTN